MALRKMNAELLLTKGIEQKVSEYIIPDESLLVAENVDFSKVGAVKKRAGFVRNSNLVLGAGVLDEMRRLGVRQRKEVLCITETVTNLGSSAGVGSAGDTIYSYSEQTQRWIARGKMPRPNVDVLWTSGVGSAGHVGALQQYVITGVDNYVCIAYQIGTTSQVRIVVFDVGGEVSGALREAPTVVIDQAVDLSGGYLAGWGQAGGNCWLVFGSSPLGATTGPSDFARAVCFRSDTATLDLTEVPVDGGSPHFVSADGTFIYVVTRLGTEGYKVLKFDSNMTVIALGSNAATGLGLAANEIAIDARLGHIDLVRHGLTTGNVYVSRLNKNTLFHTLTNQFVTTGSAPAAGTGHSNVTIATVSDSDAVIIWANQFTSITTTQSNYLFCGLMRMTTGALLGYFNHLTLVPYAQPFIFDGRVFFIAMHSSGLIRPNASTTDLTGSTAADESFMCFQIPLDSMNPNTTPFPCAQWDYGRVVAKLSFFNSSTAGSLWLNGRHVYQSGTGVYVLTNTASGVGQSELQWSPVPRLVRLEMGDAVHRWRSEEFYDYAAFAGGVPFTYDGTRAYEASTALHRPIHVAHGRVGGGGGALTADLVHYFRVATLHVDGNGRECWSQPSITVEVTPTGAELTAYFTAIPVTTTMRPDVGNGSSGRMFLYLFGTTSDAPNEFKVCAEPVEIWPTTVNPISMYCLSLSEGNTQMYTNGFELDNFPAPPCRVIAAHSGRLFAIASDSNELWYTKPYRAERCPEFALGQSIPLPDKGTALCSLNDRLAVFTHHGILIVGGDGPDVTGTPPDAFSRPALVSPDYGCVEYNAVGRTPLGVIFRGHQGFYLLTMGLDVTYIGAQVESTTAAWQATRSIVHDQKNACCRITGYTGERSEELCFWYDTKRWSMNLLAEDVVDSVALGDNLLVAVADTSVALASRYRLGSRAGSVEFQDFENPYEQTIETGWLSFQNAGVFKRIWRVYVLARSAGADCTIRVQVWKDWEETPSSDREFELLASDTEPRNLRVHLKHQKLKAVKVRVSVTSDGAGADLMKVGFELGMRTGGPKEVRESTQ